MQRDVAGKLWTIQSLLFAAFVLAGLPLRANISPEAGAFVTTHYPPELYNANPQNWAIAQDHRGIMYFGNTDGVLEYDGSSWRKITIQDGSFPAVSLVADKEGTIYVGSSGDFGYLKPDAKGQLYFSSLLNFVPAADRQFGRVWTAYATKQGILFGSNSRIFLWSPQGMKVWRPTARFGRLFALEDTAYVRDKGIGLMKLEQGRLELVPGGDFVNSFDLAGAFVVSGSLVFATSRALYQQSGAKFIRYPTEADALFEKNLIYTGRQLADGDLVFGTVQGGLIFLDAHGKLERVIGKADGLPSNYISKIFIDQEGAMWLALQKGLAKLGVNLPTTTFVDRNGLGEVVSAVQRFNGKLYAATLVGLTRAVEEPGKILHFEMVPGIQGVAMALIATPHGLLAATQEGLYEIHGETAERVPSIPSSVRIIGLALSRRLPDTVYAAGNGVFQLRFLDGHWTLTKQVSSGNPDFAYVIEAEDGKVWFAPPASLWRCDFSKDPVAVEKYGRKEGIPKGWSPGYRFGGSILFASNKGLLQFAEEERRFVPYSGFANPLSAKPGPVEQLHQAPNGDVWISGATYNGVLSHDRSGGYTWHDSPLSAAGIVGSLMAVYFDSDNVAWVSSTAGGLGRYARAESRVSAANAATLIRKVTTLRTRATLFAGDGRIDATEIPYVQNSLRFDFSSPIYEDEARTQYQVWLEGLDRSWSDWSSESRKEYTNITIGHFVFHVRARDAHGRIGAEAQVAFRVLPPWFRTWWAYLLYFLLASALMWMFVKWRVSTLKARNRNLENLVLERTEEIRAQRDEIKAEEEKATSLLLNILPGAVADELRINGSVKPMAFENVTICFTDFVGFTLSSERVPAPDLVDGLHKYFTAFDEIMGRYGLEKMKTIGDSYMFVGGMPDKKPSHAIDSVMAALEIAETVERFCSGSPSWAIRIGLHSGPVIAGVVGVRKFAYDIWGETVNFASRFESSGRPNFVNISTKTHELVEEFIECDARGPVRIKEGRLLDMYFARGIRKELLGGELVNGVPAAFGKKYEEHFGYPPAWKFRHRGESELFAWTNAEAVGAAPSASGL